MPADDDELLVTVENVVLVVLDALRRDRVGPFGCDRELTPTIDRLAANGTTFENAFAATNATDPSMTSIHSGRDPAAVVRHHGPYVTDDEKRRTEAVRALPERLQEESLTTVATGRLLSRWHRAGFDHYPESALSRNRRRKLGERLERIHPVLRTVAGWLYETVTPDDGDTDRDDAVDTLLESVGEGPFYGLVHLMDTHAPYDADPELVEDLLERYEYSQRDLSEFLDEHPDNEYLQEFVDEMATDRDYEYGVGRLVARYDATVREADAAVGRLVDGLRTAGLYDETLVVVTSDHGESMLEHGIFFDHHGLYDQSIRVPLVVGGGPEVFDGARSEFVQLFDLAPTVAEALDADAAFGGESRSLWPLLDGRPDDWEEREFVVAREAHAQSRVAIRTDEWKLIRHVPDDVLDRERGGSLRCGYCDTLHGAEEELFRLSSDPGETENVVDDHAERATSLGATLDEYESSVREGRPDRGSSDVEYEGEEELFDRLEDLGYR